MLTGLIIHSLIKCNLNAGAQDIQILLDLIRNDHSVFIWKNVKNNVKLTNYIEYFSEEILCKQEICSWETNISLGTSLKACFPGWPCSNKKRVLLLKSDLNSKNLQWNSFKCQIAYKWSTRVEQSLSFIHNPKWLWNSRMFLFYWRIRIFISLNYMKLVFL